MQAASADGTAAPLTGRIAGPEVARNERSKGPFFVTTGFLRHHYAAPRFWPFQLVKGGWLLAAAVLLLAATVRFARHRAA